MWLMVCFQPPTLSPQTEKDGSSQLQVFDGVCVHNPQHHDPQVEKE